MTSLLVLAACTSAMPRGAVEASKSIDAGPDGCAVDTDCPGGMVCEGCATAPKQCVPGCRTDAQCPTNRICLGGVSCTTCPCAPGWCQLDPCRDVDHDGYIANADPDLVCPGKQKGDCDDADPVRNPGHVERCGNYVDDNCNGQADENCPVCANQSRCAVAVSCGQVGQSYCENFCCARCPAVQAPQCQPGECLRPGVPTDTGCPAAPTCGACSSCVGGDAPVCGLNFATYANRCQAEEAHVEVLHVGACLSGEGASCDARSTGTYCGARLFCPAGDAGVTGRCMQFGSCLSDADCAFAGSVENVCDGGPSTLRCQARTCVATCQ